MKLYKPYYVAGVRPEPDFTMDKDLRRRFLFALQHYGWNCEKAEQSTINDLIKAHVALRREGKGLVISGNIGAGKTTLMNAYIQFFRAGYLYYDMHDLGDVQRLYNALGPESSIDLRYYNVAIDDVGFEIQRNDYGSYSEVIGMLLEYLGRFRRPLGRLVITTNMDEDELIERYGGPEISRLSNLCVPLHYQGEDRRNWTDTKKVDVEHAPEHGEAWHEPYEDDDFSALLTPETAKKIKEMNTAKKVTIEDETTNS